MEIEKIKKIKFNMGNPFCGIKKMLIDFEYQSPLIKHNGWKEEPTPKFLKEEIIKDLREIVFENWEEKYINKEQPNDEYYWYVYIQIDDKEYEYEGLNKYPSDWNIFIKFVEKYTTIKFEK